MLERLKRIFVRPKSQIECLREAGCKIGENVDLVNSRIDGCHSFLITIGDNVTITNATLLAHDASTKKALGYSKVGRVTIGSDVFIGFGSIILPGTSIGNKVIVGAGTVVAKDVPDNVVIAGNPFRVLCSYDEYMEKNSQRIKNGPIFKKLFSDKTQQEKEDMFKQLDGTIGFDL